MKKFLPAHLRCLASEMLKAPRGCIVATRQMGMAAVQRFIRRHHDALTGHPKGLNMMEPDILKAFEALTPKDQLVIVAMIIALSEKHHQITECAKNIMDKLRATNPTLRI